MVIITINYSRSVNVNYININHLGYGNHPAYGRIG